MENPITANLINFMQHVWVELKQVIQRTPAEQWILGSSDYLIPARLAYHIVFAADLYASHMGYEEYKPYRKYKMDWEAAPAEQLPTQDQIMTFIDETAQTVTQWLTDLGDAGLLEAETDYPWTGTVKLGRAIFIKSHCQWHIAEMFTILRERGIDPGDW